MAVSDKPWGGFSAADYDPAQWRRACLIDTGQGAPDAKSRYKVPVREPDGTLSRGGVHAAAGGHGVGAVTGISPAQRQAAAKKLVGLYRNDLGEDPPESLLHLAGMAGSMNSAGPAAESLRSVPFHLRAAGGDGLTLDGYAAVFDTPTTIRDFMGEYEETIAPGAFARALADQTPVLMFDHGQHPLIGSLPLGVIQRAEEDQRGLHVVARLTDNWLVQPVRDAVRDGGIRGMSFRFQVPDGGDVWTRRKGGLDQRLIREAYPVPELGPVVFPAYEPTTVAVRSVLAATPGLDAQVRQMLMPGAESGEDPAALAQAACAALDAAMTACAGLADMPPEMQQACALMLAADSALDGLLAALGAPDLPDTGRSLDLTGQPAARSGGGGDSTTGGPGSGPSPSPSPRTRALAHVLRLEGIIP